VGFQLGRDILDQLVAHKDLPNLADVPRISTGQRQTHNTGARVGTGGMTFGGITIDADALVGAGSLVTHNVPPGTIAFGHPERVHGQATR
jgi:hypothetical protein